MERCSPPVNESRLVDAGRQAGVERADQEAVCNHADGDVSSVARSVAAVGVPALRRDAQHSGSRVQRGGAALPDFVLPSTLPVLTYWRLARRSSRPVPRADPGVPGRRRTLRLVGRSDSSTLSTSLRSGRQAHLAARAASAPGRAASRNGARGSPCATWRGLREMWRVDPDRDRMRNRWTRMSGVRRGGRRLPLWYEDGGRDVSRMPRRRMAASRLRVDELG